MIMCVHVCIRETERNKDREKAMQIVFQIETSPEDNIKISM